MKLPKLQKPDKYVGLYVIDFGDSVSVGFTAQEVAEILESEKYKDCKVYKIHKAYPDGKIELKGLPSQTFQLEAGMFFYSNDIDWARQNFKELVTLAERTSPPCRAKVHLAEYNSEKFTVALIYPAEHDDEISSWLLAGKYKTEGPAEAGIGAVQRYYNDRPQVLDRRQLFSQSQFQSNYTGEQLLSRLKLAVQR